MISFGPIKKEHLPFLKKWRNQQKNILRQTKILTDKDQKQWFKKIQKDNNQRLFAIYDSSTGSEQDEFIGYCGLVYIDFRHKKAELSFLVNTKRAKNRKTYKQDFLASLKMLTIFGFKKLGLNKIFTETISFRKGHMEILEEFGLKKEAVLKGQYLEKGKFYNSIIHSIFNK